MAPDNEKYTKDDVQYHITASVGYRFPCINDLLLEFIEKSVVLLLLAGLFLAIVVSFVVFVLVSHLNIYYRWLLESVSLINPLIEYRYFR